MGKMFFYQIFNLFRIDLIEELDATQPRRIRPNDFNGEYII